MRIKALSVRQPHADRIARGLKTLELRTRRTHYRGPLLICASSHGGGDGLPRGVAVCVVRMTDCREVGVNSPDTLAADAAASCVDLDPRDDYWGYVLAGARKTQPIPVKGRLGFFDVEVQGDLLFA